MTVAPHYCVQCGERSNDWLVEAGILPPSQSWCGNCKMSFGKKLTERMIDQLCKGMHARKQTTTDQHFPATHSGRRAQRKAEKKRRSRSTD